MKEPGIYPNLSNEDYHKDSAISRSHLKSFNELAFKYWAEYHNPNRPAQKTTKAMEFGSAFHCYILEPEKFTKEYLLKPSYHKSPERVLLKNVGRPAYEAYKAEKAKIDFLNTYIDDEFETAIADGKKVLTIDDQLLLEEMSDALHNHTEAHQLIKGALYENSLFWLDKDSGLMLKCRPDVWQSNMIIDLKTCDSASVRSCERAMADEMYHVQAAMVREGIKELTGVDIPNCINLYIEKKYPYAIAIRPLSENALKEGRKKFKEVLLDLKHAIQYNDFPSYPIEDLDLPGWY